MNTTLQLGDRTILRVGLGTNRVRDTPRDIEFIRNAVAAGLNFIDTAHLYTAGQSEKAIGAALVGMSEKPVVATKGGYAPGQGRPDVLRAQIDESLRRLQTDSIELFYLHRVDPETPLEDSLGAIKACQDKGMIRHAGLSAVTVEQIQRARTVLRVSAVQNHYNLSERQYDDIVDYCEREGIVFVPYYPMRFSETPALRRVARRLGATEAQVALAWLLQRSSITAPIPGTVSLQHLKENLGALDISLREEDVHALR